MKLPDFQPQLGMSPDPQGAFVSPYHFGNEGEAAAHLGGDVANFAFGLLEKRKQAQDQDYAYSNLSKDATDFKVWDAKTRASLPPDDHGNTDYKGYSDKVGQWMQDRFQQNQDNAPSETARLLYRHHAGQLFTQQYNEASHIENTELAKNYVNNITTDADTTGRLLESTPDLPYARQQIELTKQRARAGVGTIADESLSKKVIENGTNRIATAALDGLYTSGKGDTVHGKAFLQQGINILLGNVQGGKKLSDGMTIETDPIKDSLRPHQIEQYLLKFQAALKDNNETSLVELNKRFHNSVTAMTLGQPGDPSVMQDLGNATAAGLMERDELARKIDIFTTAKDAGNLRKSLEDSAPKDWPGIIAQFEKTRNQGVQALQEMFPDVKAVQKPAFNATEKQALTSELEPKRGEQFSAVQNQILAERIKDPVGYVVRHFPAIANLYGQAGDDPKKTEAAINSSLAKQQQLGIGDGGQRISSLQDSFKNSQFVTSNDPAQVANGMTALEKKYGSYFSQAFTEMVADKTGVDPRLWAASYIKDPIARQKAVAAVILKDDAIDKAFKARYTPIDEKAMVTQVKQQTGEMFAGLARTSELGGSLQLATAMQDLVEARAKTIMATRTNVSPKDAVREAMGMVDSAFGVAKGGNSTVTFPREIANRPMDQKIIEAHMQAYVQPDALATKNLYIDPSIGGPANSEKEKADMFYKYIQDKGQWSPNAKNDGIFLQIPTPHGLAPVTTKTGQKLEFKYTDMLGNVKDQFVNKQLNTGIFQKIFGH